MQVEVVLTGIGGQGVQLCAKTLAMAATAEGRQALLSAVIGFALAACVGLVVVETTAESALPILMTPTLTACLFVLTIVMCVTSALAAIVQVIRIDPVRVFRQ